MHGSTSRSQLTLLTVAAFWKAAIALLAPDLCTEPYESFWENLMLGSQVPAEKWTLEYLGG